MEEAVRKNGGGSDPCARSLAESTPHECDFQKIRFDNAQQISDNNTYNKESGDGSSDETGDDVERNAKTEWGEDAKSDRICLSIRCRADQRGLLMIAIYERPSSCWRQRRLPSAFYNTRVNTESVARDRRSQSFWGREAKRGEKMSDDTDRRYKICQRTDYLWTPWRETGRLID